MDGHEHIGGVDHHGDGGEEDGVEDGLFPGLQDIDASDEQVLVVQPGQVVPEVFEVHPAGWMKRNGGGASSCKKTMWWRRIWAEKAHLKMGHNNNVDENKEHIDTVNQSKTTTSPEFKMSL